MAATSHPYRRDELPWQQSVAAHQQPSTKRAVWQLINTLVPYALLWPIIYGSFDVSIWLALPFVILASGFLVRIFIIFHDCTHGSYLRSRRANHIVGVITGILTFCPYLHWRWEHAVHHGSAGDLDKRGTGDIWTMTVQEYLEASRLRRIQYRLVRNPFVLFSIAPLLVFAIKHRMPHPRAKPRERRSVMWMNLTLLIVASVMSLQFGLAFYVLVQAIMLTIAGAVGLWLFYVQHQFEGVYWERGDNWDYTKAALQGSSFYKLPKVLQWFTGNIGFHHIHHLSPRVPNYNLQRCHETTPLFQQVRPITLSLSVKSLAYRLWDEQSKQLVGYAHALRRAQAAGSSGSKRSNSFLTTA